MIQPLNGARSDGFSGAGGFHGPFRCFEPEPASFPADSGSDDFSPGPVSTAGQFLSDKIPASRGPCAEPACLQTSFRYKIGKFYTVLFLELTGEIFYIIMRF